MTARVACSRAATRRAGRTRGAHAPTHDGLRDCDRARDRAHRAGAPPLDVELDNAIPLGAGLGSSAAAYALGVAIGARLVERAPADEALALAVAELDGHPDNALAAWYGGAVVASLGDDGLTSARFAAPPSTRSSSSPSSRCRPTTRARCFRNATAAPTLSTTCSARRCLGAALAAGRLELLRDGDARPAAPAIPRRRDPGLGGDPRRSTTPRSSRSRSRAPGRPCWRWSRDAPARIGELIARRSRATACAARLSPLRLASDGVTIT